MEAAMLAFSSQTIHQPVRTVLPINPDNGFFFLMPAVASGSTVGVKLLTWFPNNEEKFQKPAIHAIINLFHPQHGAPLCSMAGEYITGIRTAAVSAVSTKYLSREDSSVLLIIGTGVQAKCHIATIVRVRPITDVRICGRTQEKVDQLISESQSIFPHLRFSGFQSVEASLDDQKVDIIVTATSSRKEVLFGSFLKP
eukprot:TRINITY_DN604_c0_g1_i3.p1 TRINITY_DN604_c0_g1~~TRINITY_DN604_c0_g1_i3.p1  ORF type:complete len:231 (-),score=57.03 TRINITY_DN604_c0_g1_i3:446-1036(-)